MKQMTKNMNFASVSDSSDEERLGPNLLHLKRAKKETLWIDHPHNQYPVTARLILAGGRLAIPPVKSCSEQLNQDNVDKNTAECLYTGLIHDTGVFKYSCTSCKDDGNCWFPYGKGIDFGSIIDKKQFL